nr:MBL fold metallo-hydrolase [Lachnospiraceae bacterium]
MSETIKINDNTWRFEDDGVRFFLFCGSEKAALIDSGMKTPDALELARGITALPIIMINTHADPDHISGNGMFNEFFMSPDEEENYRENGGKGTLLPIHEGDVIDLGDRPLRIIDIPGHTPGSIAILDEKNRVLISGD